MFILLSNSHSMCYGSHYVLSLWMSVHVNAHIYVILRWLWKKKVLKSYCKAQITEMT